jgi:hypothetical protein
MSRSIISRMKLANNELVTIYLIEQQLKCRRFFDDLANIGLGDYDFEPNLDHLILKNLNLDDGTDQTYDRYTRIIDKHSKRLKHEYKTIEKQSVKMYKELVALKKKLSKREM